MKLSAGAHPQAVVEWEVQEHMNHSNCQNIGTLNYLLDRGFCIVKIVNSIFQRYPFSADDLYKVIFNSWKPEEVTLILNSWTPRSFVPNPKLKNPLLCRKTYDQKSH